VGEGEEKLGKKEKEAELGYLQMLFW